MRVGFRTKIGGFELFLKFKLSLARVFSYDTSLELAALIPNFARVLLIKFFFYYFLRFNHKCMVFRFFPELSKCVSKFHNSGSTGRTLLIDSLYNVEIRVFLLFYIPKKRVFRHYFFKNKYRNTFLSRNHEAVDLSIWIEFQLDNSKHS